MRLELAFLLLSFCWLGTFYENVHGEKDAKPSRSVFTKGDFVIGGLSPVHFSPTAAEEQADPDSFMCQGGFNTRGFEAVEAMLFAMDMVNEGRLKHQLLPNVTIGMDIKDTCTSSDYAVRESLNFTFIRNANVKDECSGVPRQRDQHTIAVVGAAYSRVSMAVTNLCGLFYVPLVSYASTSRLLSNKVHFRYFLRTVPSDMFQAQVMADLVRAMNSNFVIALSSDTEYGRSGIEAFKLALAKPHKGVYDVCIPIDERFTKRSPSTKFERIFRLMKANTKAKVVILFAELHDANFLIDKFSKQEDLAKEKYVWIGSDAWAQSKQVLKGNEHVLKGMLAVVPEVKNINEFDEYFVDFNDHRRSRNPWMREYEQIKVAHNPRFHRQVFRHYPKAQYVMEAVLAVAHALHDMLGCVPYKDCSKKAKTFSQRNQKDFLGHLQKVRFYGMTREIFSFDQLGDAIGVYDIHQLALVGENYEFVNFGKWGLSENCESVGKNSSAPCLQLNRKNINDEFWRNSSNKDYLLSRCSADCPPGFRIDPQEDHAKCCWDCKRCRGKTITTKTNTHDCYPCPLGYWATANQSSCEPISPTYLGWTDAPAIIIICISAVGLLGVMCTFYVFYCFRDTPVVRASSRELCYVLLIGIGWCFITPLFFIAEPTDKICRAIPIVTGLCPALVVGTLLTKTNRISRIFNKKLIKTGTQSFLSKKWQLLMIMCVCLLECIINIASVYMNAAGSQTLISDTKREVIKQCKELSDISIAIWWVYNTGLVITCTYQAFLTRKLPENYNEAKFITLTMLTTCIVVIIFIPTYIGTSGIYRTTITCFVFVIAGFAGLACMFVPKVYIILLRPQKNVAMQPRSSSVRLGTISTSASFVRRLSVDNSPAEEEKSSRNRRVKSLPVIQTPRGEEEENDGKVPITKRRSASMYAAILREKGAISPNTSITRRKQSRSVKVTIERIMEEVNECEPSDTESKQFALDSLFETQPAPAVEYVKEENDENLDEQTEAEYNDSSEDTQELETTEADRLLAFYQDLKGNPTTCTEKYSLNNITASEERDISVPQSLCGFTQTKPQYPLHNTLEMDNCFDSRLPHDSELQRPTPNAVNSSDQNRDSVSNAIPHIIWNSAPNKFVHVNGGQSLVGVPSKGIVNSSTGSQNERRRRNAVCRKDPRKPSDGNDNEGLESTQNGVGPQCNKKVSCQLAKRPRSQDELSSPQETLCCKSEGSEVNKSSIRAVTWLQALSKGAGHRNHVQSAPSLADGIPVCDVRQDEGGPETIL